MVGCKAVLLGRIFKQEPGQDGRLCYKPPCSIFGKIRLMQENMMPSEKMEKINVPDEDVPGWLQTLREGGFTDVEINSIMSHLNETYAGFQKDVAVNKELEKMDGEIRARRGFSLSNEEKTKLREGIESRFVK